MFYGRERQIADLEVLWKKRTASLVTCRGRRRIGKSSLIERFAQLSKSRFIVLEGVRPKRGMRNEDELAAFGQQLSARTGSDPSTPSNWLSAFIRLNDKIRDDERTVVLLDEVSWMGHYDPLFADTLKVAWDNYWKKHDRLIVVVCGSVSTWIRENVVDNGAFVGRRSLDLVVDELPLAECVRFWGTAAKRIDTREIVDLLSVTGGVPRYLEEIDPGASTAENIRRLCFTPHGILREDFDDMFTDTVTRLPSLAGRILRLLAEGSLAVSELAAKLGMGRSGTISDALDCLVEAGFVRRDGGVNPETGDTIRQIRYRLKDNYARFYLKYIEPVKTIIDDGSYEVVSLAGLPGWEAVLGLAFENLVVNNYRSLIPHFHLDGTLITSAAPYVKSGTNGCRGCQVDLLLQTRKAVYVIEVKRRQEIGREVIQEVDDKVRAIRRPKGVSIRTALVYDGELHPGVVADGYFDAVIPFRTILGL